MALSEAHNPFDTTCTCYGCTGTHEPGCRCFTCGINSVDNYLRGDLPTDEYLPGLFERYLQTDRTQLGLFITEFGFELEKNLLCPEDQEYLAWATNTIEFAKLLYNYYDRRDDLALHSQHENFQWYVEYDLYGQYIRAGEPGEPHDRIAAVMQFLDTVSLDFSDLWNVSERWVIYKQHNPGDVLSELEGVLD